MKINKQLLKVIFILFVIVIIFYFINIFNAHNIIERKLKIKLPYNTKVEKFSYNIFNDCFYAKISLNSKGITNIKNQLSIINSEEGKFNDQINFDDCKWWDMDNNNIATFYNKLLNYSKISHKTRDVWLFITKEVNKKYYLYISY